MADDERGADGVDFAEVVDIASHADLTSWDSVLGFGRDEEGACGIAIGAYCVASASNDRHTPAVVGEADAATEEGLNETAFDRIGLVADVEEASTLEKELTAFLE